MEFQNSLFNALRYHYFMMRTKKKYANCIGWAFAEEEKSYARTRNLHFVRLAGLALYVRRAKDHSEWMGIRGPQVPVPLRSFQASFYRDERCSRDSSRAEVDDSLLKRV